MRMHRVHVARLEPAEYGLRVWLDGVEVLGLVECSQFDAVNGLTTIRLTLQTDSIERGQPQGVDSASDAPLDSASEAQDEPGRDEMANDDQTEKDGKHDAGSSSNDRRRATNVDKTYEGRHRTDDRSIRNHRVIDPRDQSDR